MESIRVGVIGVGNIGTKHADNINQNKIEGMELTAVCDANPTRLMLVRSGFRG